jgi:preprotein translocase subunit Sss1
MLRASVTAMIVALVIGLLGAVGYIRNLVTSATL